jgi:hypothetical protein
MQDWRSVKGGIAMIKRARDNGIAAFIAFVGFQTAPALAYGPNEVFGRPNSVNAMVYFHLPLGVSRTEQDRTASFGFTVKSEFQNAHPAHQGERAPYSTSTTLDLMGLRFGMDGKLSGLDLGGLNALGDKARVSTVTDGGSGTK